jgi:putative membrane protein
MLVTFLANILVILIAFLHIGFLVLEMFFWQAPIGLKVFRQSSERAHASAVLAANQGLYNGFLAVGLLWGLAEPNPDFSHQIKIFFLLCVSLAGIYGAWSVNRRIFLIQALPALIALALLLKGP